MIGAALLLAGCSDDKPQPLPIPVPAPPPPAAWQFQYSPGLSVAASYGIGGFIFSFPASDGAHYLVKGWSSPVKRLGMSWSVLLSDGAVMHHKLDECGPESGATVTFYIQQVNDVLVDMNGRWFGWPQKRDIATGSYSLALDTSDNDAWSNVYGKKQSDVGFSLPNMIAQAVGVTFGGGCAAGHGAWVTPGTAAFTAELFEVQ